MLEENLEFLIAIDGRKPHFIFKQGNKFYEMSSLDNDKRGNFIAIDADEVEKTKQSIVKECLQDKEFHPKDIKLFPHMDEEYRVHRLRSICYVLIAQGYMGVLKAGRELHFVVTGKFEDEMKMLSSVPPVLPTDKIDKVTIETGAKPTKAKREKRKKHREETAMGRVVIAKKGTFLCARCHKPVHESDRENHLKIPCRQN